MVVAFLELDYYGEVREILGWLTGGGIRSTEYLLALFSFKSLLHQPLCR